MVARVCQKTFHLYLSVQNNPFTCSKEVEILENTSEEMNSFIGFLQQEDGNVQNRFNMQTPIDL